MRGEETGLVLRGQIDLILDGIVYNLKEGVSFSFRSHVPHLLSQHRSGTGEHTLDLYAAHLLHPAQFLPS